MHTNIHSSMHRGRRKPGLHSFSKRLCCLLRGLRLPRSSGLLWGCN